MWVTDFRARAFTLLEIMIVVVIIGILATISVNYRPIIERATNREAVTNLKLIAAAERIYKLEAGGMYYPVNGSSAEAKDINEDLRLYLPIGTDVKWIYAVTGGVAFTATATRSGAGSDGRVWTFTSANVDAGTEPSCAGGSFCD